MCKKQKIIVVMLIVILTIIPMAGPNRLGGGTGTISITEDNILNG